MNHIIDLSDDSGGSQLAEFDTEAQQKIKEKLSSREEEATAITYDSTPFEAIIQKVSRLH
jgi:hypothetical protein